MIAEVQEKNCVKQPSGWRASSARVFPFEGTARTSRRYILAGALVTAIVTVAYLVLFWNRFLGLRSGAGEFAGGSWLLEGYLPYRDFFCPTTTLTAFKSAAILAVLGKAVIVTRAFAVFERVLLGLLVYFWLTRMFRVGHAVVAALVTIVVASGDIADPLASYNHDTILLAVAAGFFASVLLYRRRDTRSIALFALLCGACAGLSFLSKQTIGALATASIVVILSLWLLRQDGVRKALIFFAGFCAGWAAMAGLFLLWLARLGILYDFFRQVFVQGPAAKAAHLADFLNREIFVGNMYRPQIIGALVLLLISWRAFHRSELKKKEEQNGESSRFLIWVLLVGLASVYVGALASYHALGPVGPTILKPVVYLTLFGSAVQTLYFGVLLLRGRLSPRQAQFCVYAAISFAVAASLSLSYPVFEAMIVPGLGLLVAAVLDASSKRLRVVVCAACALLIAVETCAKLNLPFGFAGFNEAPVRSAHFNSELPELKGLHLPESTVRFVDETVRIIQTNSSPQDRIFVYPEIGILYPLSGRRCAGFSCSHNIDFVSDELAKRDAAAVLSNKPAVLVYSREAVNDVVYQMYLWRNGNPSPNPLALIAACESLAQQYRLVKTFTLEPQGKQIMVFVRPPAEQAQKTHELLQTRATDLR